MFGGHKVNFVF